MSNDIILKSNHLIEASYRLSLNEQRLILAAISQLDERKPVFKDSDVVITAAEFSETFGIPLKQAYEALDNAASRLYGRSIRNIRAFDCAIKTKERSRWVDNVKYWYGEAKVTLSFSRWVVPYLTMLRQQFTSHELEEASKLSTAYAIRFYELLVRLIKTDERHITLKQLRELLELENQYQRFFDFKKCIIAPSINEINQTTSLTVEWKVMKKGRVITGLMFIFQNTNQLKLPV